MPAILHSCLQTLVFVVDRAMLGRVGEASLAAMQIAGPVEWSVFSVLLAFEVGAIAKVGHYVGARRGQDAKRAAAVSLTLAVAFGVGVIVLAPLVLSHLDWMAPRASPSSLAEARAYLTMTLLASPVVFLAAGAVAVLQASGDTRTPLFVAIACNLVHVGLNRWLILGGFGVPALGMRGCGISTAVTFGLQAALLLALLCREGRSISLRGVGVRDFADAAMAREVLGVAAPSVLERALYHAGFLSFSGLIGRLGDEVMASNQTLLTFEAICFLSADGFGIAAASLVAQKLGAGLPGEASRAARIAARDAVLVLSAIGIALFLTRHTVVPLLVPNAAIATMATSGMVVLMVAQPFMALSIVLAQSLRGAGKTRAVLMVTSASAVGVRLLATWSFAVAHRGGLRGVWWGSTADWAVRSVLLALLFRAVFVKLSSRGHVLGADAR